jgi:methylenetetrahydrofolate reductase (NADPH)
MAERFGLVSQAAIIPSILLVRGPSALRFIDEKVPGISVPRGLIERCESAPDPEEACFQLGLAAARHALQQPGVAGLHLISFRREAGIARLCQELGIPTRAEREASGYRPAVAI